MRRIPIEYIANAQRLYVRIFEWEDRDFIPWDECRSYAQCKRAYGEYLEKMFLDDDETAKGLDTMFNQTLITRGDYARFCDYVRSRGYEVLSKDNSTEREHELCKRECAREWREWKTLKTTLYYDAYDMRFVEKPAPNRERYVRYVVSELNAYGYELVLSDGSRTVIYFSKNERDFSLKKDLLRQEATRRILNVERVDSVFVPKDAFEEAVKAHRELRKERKKR